MNAMSPLPSLIPENAPFSPQQRAWLNGFLAGLYGGASAGVSIAPAPAPPESEEFPWHDPVLELPERLDVAALAIERQALAVVAVGLRGIGLGRGPRGTGSQHGTGHEREDQDDGTHGLRPLSSRRAA